MQQINKLLLQESLPNTKVSARQPCILCRPALKKSVANQRTEHNVESTFSGLQLCSIFVRLAVVASEICEISRISPKIGTYSSSRSCKVIDLGVNQKLVMQLSNSH